MDTVGYRGKMLETSGVVADAVIGKGAPLMLEYTAEFNRSWLVRIGEDRNRSYFTYYSELNRSSRGIVYVEIFFLLLLALVSTVGNLLIAYVVLSNQNKKKKYKTNTNLFIANMCVADILFTLPNPVIAIVRYQGAWKLGASCGILQYNQVVCGVVLIWSMALISMDRHSCIVKTLYKHLNELTAKIAITVCWVSSFGFAIPIYIYFSVEEFDFGADKVKICTLMWPKGPLVRVSAVYVTILVVVFFITPFVIITYNYVSLFKTLWKQREKMKRRLSEEKRPRHPDSKAKQANELSGARNQREFRVVKMLVSTVVAFAIMWLPMALLFLLVLKDGITEAMRTSSWAFLLAVCIAFANACINPIIYGLFNQEIRRGIRHVFRRFQMPGTKQGESTSSSNSPPPIPLTDMDGTVTLGASGERKDSCFTTTEPPTAVETRL
ncbi:free fatty acid receptor 4-like [Lineus longissimus]|uniref:free fatty acid receptor 4-like n=1 Tax=Lineus longissimus TaxID=88925 RepID=UPI00315CFFAB